MVSVCSLLAICLGLMLQCLELFLKTLYNFILFILVLDENSSVFYLLPVFSVFKFMPWQIFHHRPLLT